MSEKLLKSKEIEEYLGVSRTTLWRWKKKGLPAYKVGKTIRFNTSDVQSWMVTEPEVMYKANIEMPKLIDIEIPKNNKEKILNNYIINLDYLFSTNKKYLEKIFDAKELKSLERKLKKYRITNLSNQEIVKIFSKEYNDIVHSQYQKKNRPIDFDKELNNFIDKKDNSIKIIWGDSFRALRKMESESIQLMITSPPYYNAREYSQWDNLDIYLEEMREIIKESYRVLDNHRVWVFNVGDIFDNDRLKTKSVWGKRRVPLGAYFIKIFEEEGFEFVDDLIWDKGEVESKRHMNNGMNYPFYQYPLNCYEHILIFHKHRLDKTKIPCPVCGSLNVNGNTQTEVGVQSWECKNKKCFVRSPNNRGKRFSLRTNMMQYNYGFDEGNLIDKRLINEWRRDITKFSPVIKINSSGKNTLGHTAPFPEDIPEMAIKYFSYVGENILDPFAGSFTAPIVAKKLGRKGIGIELNKKMFNKAIVNRISGNFELFNGNKSFTEFEIK